MYTAKYDNSDKIAQRIKLERKRHSKSRQRTGKDWHATLANILIAAIGISAFVLVFSGIMFMLEVWSYRV